MNEMAQAERGELTTGPQQEQVERLQAAAQFADRMAATGAMGDYLSRKAENTRIRQARGLALFADFLDEVDAGAEMRRFARDVAGYPHAAPDPSAWQGVTWGLVRGFVGWLLKAGYAVSTVNVRLSTVKTYAKLAHLAGAIGREQLALINDVSGYSHQEGRRIDARREITRVGDKKTAAVPISREQAHALKHAHADTPQGRRDALLMCILLDLGLRVGEAARLTMKHFDLAAGKVAFYRPKVDKVQVHELPPDTLKAARTYFEGDAPAEGPVFVASTKGGALGRVGAAPGGERMYTPMSERSLTRRVKALGARVGIEGLSAHDCRHYWATENAHRGAFWLMEAGGWNSIAMPARYVDAGKVANPGAAG